MRYVERQKNTGTMFKLLSIDAIKSPEGQWEFNNWHELEEGIWFDYSSQTPRKIFAALRRMEYLNEFSKGRVFLEDDQYNLLICEKATRRPIFALEYGSLQEIDNSDEDV
jgi:hypothetical protein